MQVVWPAMGDSNENIVLVGSRHCIVAGTGGGLRIAAPHILFFIRFACVCCVAFSSIALVQVVVFVERFVRLRRLIGGFKVG